MKSLLFVLMLIALPANSFALTAVELAGKLQDAYDNTRDMKADFIQTSTVKAMNMKKEGKGTLTIKKPGLLRYSYAKPERQEIIVKGDDLIMYTPGTKQVIKKTLSKAAMDKTPTTFLAGMGKIADSFDVSIPDRPTDKSYYYLALAPKGNGMGMKDIVLRVDQTTFDIAGMEFTDTSGNLTEINLSNIKTNTGVKESAFEFKIPKDASLFSE